MSKPDIIWPSGDPDEQCPECFEEMMVDNVPPADPDIAHRAFVRKRYSDDDLRQIRDGPLPAEAAPTIREIVCEALARREETEACEQSLRLEIAKRQELVETGGRLMYVAMAAERFWDYATKTVVPRELFIEAAQQLRESLDGVWAWGSRHARRQLHRPEQ